ncbi:MAG: DUF378 domain-containing protein [bacterium]
MNSMHKLAFWLLIIGGLNWLLTGLISSWDLATYVTGGVATIIYILVGLAALWELFTHKNCCKKCEPRMN